MNRCMSVRLDLILDLIFITFIKENSFYLACHYKLPSLRFINMIVCGLVRTFVRPLFLFYNICIWNDNQLYQQLMGKPMGTNLLPSL